MKQSMKIIGIAASLAFLAACSSNPVASTTKMVKASVGKMDPSTSSAIDAAKASRKKAKAADAEWRDMGKMIKKAEKLAKGGKNAEATKVANKAAKQGALGIAQANAQANAGPRF